MKKYILIIAVSIFAALPSMAQNVKNIQNMISVSDIKLTREGVNVNVEFKADVSEKIFGSDYTLILTPVMYKGDISTNLPTIIVQDNKARLSEERKLMSSADYVMIQTTGKYLLTREGGDVNYMATIPYQEWFDGASIRIDGLREGCCSSLFLKSNFIASNISVYDPNAKAAEEPIVPQEPVVVEDPMTTGDRMAFNYSFVAPISHYEKAKAGTDSGHLFDGNMLDIVQKRDIDNFIDNNREGSLIIYFPQSSKSIDYDYRNNANSLAELVNAVRTIESSNDSKVVRIVIAGFASPEGSVQINDRLAWERAVTVKEYLVHQTNMPSDMFNIYNGGADWRGLRMLVEKSDMYDKHKILDIIDNTPVWDSRRQVGRLGELMRLRGGDPYRYMFSNFFPLLRNAAYIKVYYADK